MNGYSVTAIIAALALGCLVVIGILLPTVANAQQPRPSGPPCGERAKIIESLAKKYKEVRRGIGITNGNNFVEFFVSPSGTFSVLVTPPTGPTCMVESGEGWEEIAIKPAGTPL